MLPEAFGVLFSHLWQHCAILTHLRMLSSSSRTLHRLHSATQWAELSHSRGLAPTQKALLLPQQLRNRVALFFDAFSCAYISVTSCLPDSLCTYLSSCHVFWLVLAVVGEVPGVLWPVNGSVFIWFHSRCPTRPAFRVWAHVLWVLCKYQNTRVTMLWGHKTFSVFSSESVTFPLSLFETLGDGFTKINLLLRDTRL